VKRDEVAAFAAAHLASVPIVAPIALFFMDLRYATAPVVLVGVGWLVVRRGFTKWDGREVIGF